VDQTAYNSQAWRRLPRETCRIAELFGELVGPCSGPIHRHHVDPEDPDCRTIQVCQTHHPTLHAALRNLTRDRTRRRCNHQHRYDHARRECEERIERGSMRGLDRHSTL
jgi:hypothetical protein